MSRILDGHIRAYAALKSPTIPLMDKLLIDCYAEKVSELKIIFFTCGPSFAMICSELIGRVGIIQSSQQLLETYSLGLRNCRAVQRYVQTRSELLKPINVVF